MGKVTLSGTPQPCPPSEAVTILGGLGGLGILTASWLIDSCGVRHIILLSRSGKAAAQELAGGSSHVVVSLTTSTSDVWLSEPLVWI